MPPFSNLTSCIPIKYNLHFSIPFATAYDEPTTETLNIPSIKYYIYFPWFISFKKFTPHQMLLGYQIKEAKLGETCDTYEKKEKCILVAGGIT